MLGYKNRVLKNSMASRNEQKKLKKNTKIIINN